MERIREYAREQVARTSLRKVAARAGVKVGATKKFIDGSVPYERNARAWKKWYLRDLKDGRAAEPDPSLPTPDAAGAIQMLLWPLSAADRNAAFPEVVAAFRDVFQRRSRTPPAWVAELADEAGEPKR